MLTLSGAADLGVVNSIVIILPVSNARLLKKTSLHNTPNSAIPAKLLLEGVQAFGAAVCIFGAGLN